MEMTKFDIKNYLEKIYNVPVVDVKTKITLGKFKKDVGKGYIIKDDDIKYAFVTLVSPEISIVQCVKIIDESKLFLSFLSSLHMHGVSWLASMCIFLPFGKHHLEIMSNPACFR